MLLELSLFLLSAPEPRVFGLDQQTVIAVAINLFNVAVLAIVLSKLLYNPVRNFMHKRTERINAQLDGAAKEAETVSALRAEYESKLKNIDLQKEEILATARNMAADNSRRILADAKTEADALRERAISEIEFEQARVKDELKKVIIEVSTVMTEKLVSLSMSEEVSERLFNETVAELEEANWRK